MAVTVCAGTHQPAGRSHFEGLEVVKQEVLRPLVLEEDQDHFE